MGPARRKSSKAKFRRWGPALLVVVGTTGATAWNVTRSEALAEARRAYARMDLANCVRLALDHLDRQPWNREAALLAARGLSRLDFADDAERYFQRAGRLELNDLQIRAFGLLRGLHPDRAVPVYEEILARDPNNVTAMRRMAGILLSKTEPDGPLMMADRLLKTPGGEVFGLMLRGTVYHNEQNPQRAVESFERALELDPDFQQMPAMRSLFWSEFIQDLLESGRLADASRYLARALEAGPNVALMNRLGTTYLLRGEFDEAERCFRKAAEWGPTDPDAHVNLVRLALQRGQHDEALRELEQARAVAPRHRRALLNLVHLYRRLGREDEARKAQAIIDETVRSRPRTTRNADGTWPSHAL